jgi:hypothetical protein
VIGTVSREADARVWLLTMWLDSVLLILTLTVALIGATTNATDTVAGKIVVSALLVISTALSLWVKRIEAKRSDEMQRGLRRLTRASLPTNEFIHSVERIMTEVRVAEGYLFEDTSQSIRYERELYLCRWLWANEYESIDSLVGGLVLNDQDLGELALLEERQLRAAVWDFIVGKWGKDNLQADRDLIAARVFNTVRGWTNHNDDNLGTFRTTISNDEQEAIESLSLELLDDDGNKTGAPVLEFSSEELMTMLNLRIFERGAWIARKTDEWRNEVIRYVSEVQAAEDARAE